MNNNPGQKTISRFVHVRQLSSLLLKTSSYSLQDEVYIQTTKSLIQSVLKGYNGTVFAYGATGKAIKSSTS